MVSSWQNMQSIEKYKLSADPKLSHPHPKTKNHTQNNSKSNQIASSKRETIKLLMKNEMGPIDPINQAIDELSKIKQFVVIRAPDSTLNINTGFDAIITSISISNTQKALYHIFPIKFAPLKGTLRYLKRKLAYYSKNYEFETEHQKFQVEQAIIKKTVLDFAESAQKLKHDMSINGPEFQALIRCLKEPLKVDKTPIGTNGISYCYNGIPAIISITPIAISTCALDIENCERMQVKKLEALALYIFPPEKLQWTLHYLVNKKKKAVESPVLSAIKRDQQKLKELFPLFKKYAISAHVFFQLIACSLFAVGFMPLAVYTLCLILLSIGTIIAFVQVNRYIEKNTLAVFGEKDLLNPKNAKYLEIHSRWMTKNESVEYKTQFKEELRVMTLEMQWNHVQAKEKNAEKKKKNALLKYIDTKDPASERILEQLREVQSKSPKNTDKIESPISNNPSSIAPESAPELKFDTEPEHEFDTEPEHEFDTEPEHEFDTEHESNAQTILGTEFRSKTIDQEEFVNGEEYIEEDQIDLHSPLLTQSDIIASQQGEEEDKKNKINIADKGKSEKKIMLDLQSGILSNLKGDLLDAVKEFLDL